MGYFPDLHIYIMYTNSMTIQYVISDMHLDMLCFVLFWLSYQLLVDLCDQLIEAWENQMKF